MGQMDARYPFGGLAVVGSFVALAGVTSGVAEEARTRGVAAPAFAGCAFVEGRVPDGGVRPSSDSFAIEPVWS